MLLGLFLVDRLARAVLKLAKGRLGFDSLADVASLPLLIALGQTVNVAILPVGLAYSRHIEAEADRFGLELTRDNLATARAFVKLQRTNLGYPRPGRFYTYLRASHPSLGERIDFANTYRPWAEEATGSEVSDALAPSAAK
jgi:Zn-dependent protease with chaperone function